MTDPRAGRDAAAPEDNGPLTGVRVIDLTQVLMGPFCTQLLGDFGADVIKIEPPSGDTSRGIGPMKTPGMGHDFLHINRNKRGVVLDLKHPDGLAALERLVETADVLVYNVRPQAMARLGLSYEALAAINPRLIYVGVFGYGQDGPYAAKPAYDDLIQGVIGLPSLIAQVGDGVPRYVPLAFVDRTVGLAAVNAVTAALYRREKHRPRPARRRADVRDDGAVHPGRAHGRRHLLAAVGAGRLSAAAGARAHTVPDQGRPRLRADLHRQAVAQLLRADRRPRPRRARSAPGQPRRAHAAHRRVVHRGRRGAAHAHHRRMARGARARRHPGDAAAHARIAARRSRT